MTIYECMKNLINAKYFKTKDEIILKLNVFHEHNIINDDQYKELMDLTDKMYAN